MTLDNTQQPTPKKALRSSIRGKLVALCMTSAAVALLVACSVFLAYDYRQFKINIVDSTANLADIVGGNCTAAIQFNDPDAAAGILATLSRQSEVEGAAIYTNTGELFAEFSRSKRGREIPTQPNFTGGRFGDGFVEVVQPVELNGKQIGTSYVRADLHQLHDHMRNYGLVTLLVLAGTMAMAYLLANRMQRVISSPILTLTSTARTVSTAKDYSARVENGGRRDELGVLIDCFNEMLAQIQQRDAELIRHREHLEEEVQARTLELRKTNTDLTTAKEKAEVAS